MVEYFSSETTDRVLYNGGSIILSMFDHHVTIL
jgi:hypothetical protein